MEIDDILARLFLQAEVKVNTIRLYVIPKLKAELERIEKYANRIDESVKRARQGDETALIDLVKHAFPKER